MSADFRPGTHNVKIWRNDTWSEVFVITANSLPINMSTADVKVQVRKKANSATADLSLTEASGITVGGAGSNQITISKLVDIASGNYVWDMQVAFADGVVKTYLTGAFEVYEDVTKP